MVRMPGGFKLSWPVLVVALTAVDAMTPAQAHAEDPVDSRVYAMTAEVTDTYKSFYPESGNASQIVDKYDVQYKRLSFKNSYAFTGAKRYASQRGTGPKGGWGTVSSWKCEYRVW